MGTVMERAAEMKRNRPDLSQRDIAIAMGASLRQVQRGCVRYLGREVEPAVPYSDEERARIIALLEDGCPYKEVAETVGRNAGRLCDNFPGYTLSRSELAQIRHMKRRFERLIDALGFGDTVSYSH
jgi:hypothetical protein